MNTAGIIEELVEPLLTNSSGLRSDEAISDLRIAPIDIMAMVLEAETLNLATAIDIEDDAVREGYSLKSTAPSKWQPETWERYWSRRVMIEATVRSLSAALASKNGRMVTHH